MEGRPLQQWEGRAVSEWQRAWRIPELHIFESISSTSDHVRDRAIAGAAAGTAAIADAQSAGRGRNGRSWSDAPRKSVLLSVLLRAEPFVVDPSTMPLRVGLAAARAIESVAGVRVLLKWPNDLLLADARKIAGILCEGATAQEGPWLVAGIGINVNQVEADFPPELRQHASSLRMAGARVDRPALIGALLDALRPFAIQPPPLDQPALEGLAHRDALAGHLISIDDEPAGTARGIAPDGSLIVESAAGSRRVRNGTVRRINRAPAPPSQAREGSPCS